VKTNKHFTQKCTMTKVLIVYTTSTGNTKRMAEAVAEGARSVAGAAVTLKEAQLATMDDVRACDALIMGSPMRHRTADSRIKKFIEDVCEVLWLSDEMVGKVGGVFTVGGGYGDCGAGCELAQLGLLGAFAAGGMILLTYSPELNSGDSRLKQQPQSQTVLRRLT
jgi:NAD(P)H dehydrogenase (quinone)